MRKNLVLIDFIEIVLSNNDIENIINNDKNNDYIFITEYDINFVKKYIPNIKILGIFTEFGSSYYSYSEEKNDFILEYNRKIEVKVNYALDILIKRVYFYLSGISHVLPYNMIYGTKYFYFVSFIGSSSDNSPFLLKSHSIRKYKNVLMDRLDRLIKGYDLDIILVDITDIGFFILPKNCNKVQVVDKLPSGYYEIFFTGKRNRINKDMMSHKKIHDIEINNEDELKYFLETL